MNQIGGVETLKGHLIGCLNDALLFPNKLNVSLVLTTLTGQHISHRQLQLTLKLLLLKVYKLNTFIYFKFIRQELIKIE